MAEALVIADRSQPQAVMLGIGGSMNYGDGRPGEAAALSILGEYPRTTPPGRRWPPGAWRRRTGRPSAAPSASWATPTRPTWARSCTTWPRCRRIEATTCGRWPTSTPVRRRSWRAATPGESRRDRQTLDTLVRIVDDPRLPAGVRAAAVPAIARYGPRGRRGIAGAVRLLVDGRDVPATRVAAADLLTTFAPAGPAADAAAADGVISGPPLVRSACERYLAAEPADAAAALPEVLAAADPAAREAALRLAADVPRPPEALLRAVARRAGDRDPETARLAWSALQRWTQGPSAATATPVLRSALATEAVRDVDDPAVRADGRRRPDRRRAAAHSSTADPARAAAAAGPADVCRPGPGHGRHRDRGPRWSSSSW